ncbi:MAG TPA: hypothetical protein VN882_07885 [Steroidobacteraceae bacterium]|jgi:hypothetical protein|nr:hypothetical protein [Steroidobacteraceae bacterium]
MAEAWLAGWENYYVVLGSGAAGLTGLTFVVVALIRDAHKVRPEGMNAYVTPTIVHFSGVLTLAAFVSMPHQRLLTLSLGFAVGGLAGVLYSSRVAARMPRIGSEYVAVREDWIFNVILPLAVYAGLLVSAVTIWRWPEPSLYAVAALSLAMLLIGIRNAWDVAVWMTTH